MDEARFRQEKIKEISLERRSEGFYLKFVFSDAQHGTTAEQARQLDMPSYLVVHNSDGKGLEAPEPLGEKPQAAPEHEQDLNLTSRVA